MSSLSLPAPVDSSSPASTSAASSASAVFNKKLFTNLGRSYRPVKRLAKQETAIFGGGSRKPATATLAAAAAAARRASPSQRATTAAAARRSTGAKLAPAQSVGGVAAVAAPSSARFVGWKNYTNLLDLTDGLKHQLPNFGYELYLPFVGRLLFDSTESSSSFEHLLVSRHSNSSSGAPSAASRQQPPSQQHASPPRGPRAGLLNVVLGDFTAGNTLSEVHRRDWTALYKHALLPVLKILGSGYRDQFRPLTKNYLTSTFALNRHAKRWDTLLNQACETSNVVVEQQERENAFARSSFADGLSFSIHEEEDDLLSSVPDCGSLGRDDSATSTSPSAPTTTTTTTKLATRDSSSALTKFFHDLRNATASGGGATSAARADEIQALLEQLTSTAGGLSLDGPCACCLMSPVVLVRAPLLEDASQMQQFVRSCSAVVLSIDASTFLCGHMPAHTFAENFTLKHILRSTVPAAVDHDVAKTAYVSSLTYFERLFAVQFVVAVLVEWCWTRHRLTHAVLQGNNCNYDSLPPVTLVMHRRLFDIVDRVPTVCLQSLAHERKFVYHVVT